MTDPSRQRVLDVSMIYVGDMKDGLRHGKGACMTLRVREQYPEGFFHEPYVDFDDFEEPNCEVVVSLYDGQWVDDRFTGRGYAKHQDGEYEDGMFHDGVLYDGFRVTQGELQTVSCKCTVPRAGAWRHCGKAGCTEERFIEKTWKYSQLNFFLTRRVEVRAR